MRILTSILCLLLSGWATAAETYRWVDKDGMVHYSDQPHPGAERVELLTAPPPGSVAPVAPQARPTTPLAPFVYAGCEITSPNADQVFFSVPAVSVSLTVLPALQSGHRITMQVNGRALAEWPPSSSGFMLQNLNRGSYSLQARILDENGRAVCTSRTLNFHIRQPSLLSPGRQGG
jgi:hypothetical protein